MKLGAICAGLAMSVSAAVMADTQDLGTLGSSGTGFTQNFVRYFGSGSPLGSFTDYYTFSLASGSGAAGGTVSFDFGFIDLVLNSVSLYPTGDSSGATKDTTPGSFSFSNLAGGTSYTLAVNGTLKKLHNIDLGYAYYEGTIHSIASPTPEPGWLALLVAGLAGVAVHARRRRSAAAR